MSSVNISQMQQYVQRYDINLDGKLDRPEIAQASLNLLGQDDAQAQTAGSLFSTFVQGGRDGQGLLPDANNDQALDVNELTQLARASGGQDTIEFSDFQALFPDRAQAGGSGVNIDQLQQLASQNSDKFNGNAGAQSQAPVNSQGAMSEQMGAMIQSLLGILQTILTELLPQLTGQQTQQQPQQQ